MTNIERIKFFGDIIVHVDVLRGSISRKMPERKELDRLRNRLSDKQLALADLVFKENTLEYKAATDTLITVSKDINKTILDINKVADTIAALTKIVTAADRLMKLAVRVAG